MIKPKCDKCGQELQVYGATLFCPPETLLDGSSGNPIDKDWKLHFCVSCWWHLKGWLKGELTIDEKFIRAGHKPEDTTCDHASHKAMLSPRPKSCMQCGTVMWDAGD